MLEILEATDKQIVQMSDLWHEWGLEAKIDLDDHIPGWRERYALFIERERYYGRATAFVAMAGIRIVGAMVVLLSPQENVFDRPLVCINSMYIQPSFRQRGVTRKLLLVAARDWGRQKGCLPLRIEL
jgi:L-amino acid N-acyltransferase YncA